MPGVVSVQPRVGGLLSQVAQAVGVARDVYGIKHASDMDDIAQQDAAARQQEFEDKQNGIQDAGQKVMALRYGDAVPEGTPGAVKMNFRGDESPTFIQPFKDKQQSPLGTWINTLDANGSPVQKYVEAKIGDTYPLQEKAKKDPTPHFAPVIDQEGGLHTMNTLTGDLSDIDTSGAKFGRPGKAPEDVAAKAAEKAEKVYTELGKAVETPRGNKAVQTAMSNQLSVQNALSLANKYKTNYDAMTPNDYALFVGELSKISTGGIGSQHSQESLTANTLESNWQAFKQRVGGNPTPAQLGEFVKGNVEYLNDLNAISTKTVNNYKTQIYNSYKNRLPPELQQRFQAEHGDLFPQQVPAGGATAQQAPAPAQTGSAHGLQVDSGSAIAAPKQAPTAPSAQMHDQAAQALQWARANPKDPRSAEIIRRLGGASSDETVDRPGVTNGGL